MENLTIIDRSELILITGSNGFIGTRVVETLVRYGFHRLRCFVRLSSNVSALINIINSCDRNHTTIEIFKGNLLSVEDCRKAVQEVSVVYHLAAGRGEKSYPDAYMNSVLTTRNLLEAVGKNKNFKRFVNVSSFAVYSNVKTRWGGVLDESCELEDQPHLRGEAYCYAKVRQDEMVMDYGKKQGIPFVIVRPGVVYGPGNKGITGRVGIGTFGLFLHLGGSNLIPLTYVDNCAEAIVLAGIRKGVDGEAFNVVDDHLPTSRELLKMYKKNVSHFRSIYIPHGINYFLCYLWEKYSDWSKGQLPPVFNRKKYYSYWKSNRYPNAKLKNVLGWVPRVPFQEASRCYFEYQRKVGAKND